MSVKQGTLATSAQSLPSFASTFNSHSLGTMPNGNNSLPPIQTRLPPLDTRRVDTPPTRDTSENGHPQKTSTSRKRSHNDLTSSNRDEEPSNSDRSPPLINIKEEEEVDMKDSHSPPRTNTHHHHRHQPDTEGAPSPSLLGPTPSKKRRVTISHPHPLNTDVRAPVDQTNSTPISPVVMGFTINRDNPMAIEQMKSALTVKQQQKALIEQRRGSVAGVMSPTTVTTNPVLPSPAPASKQPRPSRRSPNMVAASGGPRRHLPPAPTNSANQPARPPSPTPLVVQTQQQPPAPTTSNLPSASSLSTPPISFARRRAEQLGSRKTKPADIVISPREAQTPEQFAPGIQSAPPGQLSFGKIPMALPRLPPALGGGQSLRPIGGQVPPTPTRLSIQPHQPANVPVQNLTSISTTTTTKPSVSNRSPPGTSVPIASTLVPKTPGFQLGATSQDKAAFLAPFEVFYDALNDSKQLKGWLSEQLQRSNAMMQQLTQQQERLNDTVETLVEKRVAGMRSEMASLHRRVEELEDLLRVATSGRRSSIDYSKQKSRTPLRNEVAPGLPENYAFPPPPPSSNESQRRRVDFEPASSPRMLPERDGHGPRDGNGSPAPSELLRSNSRTELTRSVRMGSPPPRASPGSRTPYNAHSPPQTTREPSSNGHGKSERPSLSRQSSSHVPPPSSADSQQSMTSSPPHRRPGPGSRRNSVVMAPPDSQGDKDD